MEKDNRSIKKIKEGEEQKRLEMLRAKLSTFTDIDFNLFVPRTMLRLSREKMLTIQFAFWFCHIVERDLDSILKQSFQNMELIMGKTPKELVDFIKTKYRIELEKVDLTNPDYDPEDITFNDRIDIVEKINGQSDHTRFLREIKKLRNNISHGRMENLTYKEKDLLDNRVKGELVFDYIKQAMDIEGMKSDGGIVNQFTQEQQARVDVLWQGWLKKNNS